MIGYKEILNDIEIKNIIDNVDRDNNFYMSHGINHINSLLNMIDKFGRLINISDKDIELLKISAVLHDVGRGIDNDNHSVSSTIFARNYLEGKLDSEDIDVVCNIIERHSWKKDKDNILEYIWCFFDKVDFSCSRLEDNYVSKYGFKSVLEHIKDVKFDVMDNNFIFTIISDESITSENLFEEKNKYDIGIRYNVSVISKVLGMSYKVYFDDELLYCGDGIFDIENYKK